MEMERNGRTGLKEGGKGEIGGLLNQHLTLRQLFILSVYSKCRSYNASSR